MDKKLFVVNITLEGELTIPVIAVSKEEANKIADMSCSDSDFDFDSSFYTNEMKSLPDWLKTEIPEGLGIGEYKTCLEIYEDLNKEKIKFEEEESWPKLPGFNKS